MIQNPELQELYPLSLAISSSTVRDELQKKSHEQRMDILHTLVQDAVLADTQNFTDAAFLKIIGVSLPEFAEPV